MHLLDLPEIAARTSAIGFGCGGLGARVSSDDSLRLLQAAADGGVRHLDVARSYGYGHAEAVVGRLLQGRRDDFFVVSKAGILPAAPSRVRDLAVGVARRVLAVAPALRPLVSRGADATFTPTVEVPALSASLDQSLVELGTDHLDLLMLHEASAAGLTDEVRAWLDGVVTSGRARAWGIATTVDDTHEILAASGAGSAAVPFAVNLPSSASAPRHELLAAPGPRLRAVHSALGTDLRLVGEHLERSGRREHWQERLSTPLGAEDLPDLLLRAARARNPGGVVLVGTQQLRHVAALAAAGVGDVDPASSAAVEELAAEAAAGAAIA